MKFSGYNLINQRLDSEWLIKLLRFCSNDYSGAIGESEDGDPLELTVQPGDGGMQGSFALSPCTFTVGGQIVDMVQSGENAETISGTITQENNFFGIVFPLDEEKQDTKITTNILDSVTYGLIDGFTITTVKKPEVNVLGQIEEVEYYSIMQTETEQGWNYYHYETKKFDSITVQEPNVPDPTTLSNVYVIPVVGYNETTGDIVRLLGYKTGSALEEFLTKEALDKLMALFNDRFVWRTGSSQEYPERGRIGDLVVNSATLSPYGTYKDSDNVSPIVLKTDRVRLRKTSGDFYPEGVLLVSSKSNIYSRETLPIEYGGTNATDEYHARKNMKIITSADRYYKEGKTNAATIKGKAPNNWSNAADGWIYFSIIDPLE